jgi:preprotein translocase subunit Sss1
MNNFFNSKNKKISATISLVWLVFWYAITMTGYDKDFQIFFIIGLIPIIIGWGVYFIWQKEFEKNQFNFILDIFKKFKTKNKSEVKSKKSSSEESSKISHIVASGLGIIGGILLFRIFGLAGVVSFGIGTFLYLKLIKTQNNLFSITASILAATFSYVVIIGAIYLIRYY